MLSWKVVDIEGNEYENVTPSTYYSKTSSPISKIIIDSGVTPDVLDQVVVDLENKNYTIGEKLETVVGPDYTVSFSPSEPIEMVWFAKSILDIPTFSAASTTEKKGLFLCVRSQSEPSKQLILVVNGAGFVIENVDSSILGIDWDSKFSMLQSIKSKYSG